METFTDTATLTTIAAAGALVAAGFGGWWWKHRPDGRSACRHTDALTQFPTRQGFMTRARQALIERQSDMHPAALLMMDLDRFKKINERHGRTVGDRALAHFATILRRCTGSSDVVARLAGEEFCALVSRDDAGEALRIAHAICEETRSNPFVLGGERVPMTVSIGVAHYAAGGSLETMVARADRYLFLAKARGGDQAMDREPRLRSRAWTGAQPQGRRQSPDTTWAI
ncbi:MAG TPA: GGDEF domain-containing protein [Burkholderiaceae bacterium]|nr:GGDEF domain-containing protein [Burkholderiaceae bacterium]